MENIFVYEVKIDGFLSKEEALLIYNHLKGHKDTEWYTNEGEFGFGLVNYYKDRDFNRPWSFFEIDTVLKSFEATWVARDQSELKNIVRDKLWQWCQAIRVERERLHARLDFTKSNLKAFTGLDSWLELLQMLAEQIQGKEVVELRKAQTNQMLSVDAIEHPQVWQIEVIALKAAAFDEQMQQSSTLH